MNEMEAALQRALEKTGQILTEGWASEKELADEIHKTKSLLYVAIERTGMRAERLLSLQRMLRELLVLVTGSGDFRDYERRLAQVLLEDILERCGPEIGEKINAGDARLSVGF